MSKYLASVFRNKMFVIFDMCGQRKKLYVKFCLQIADFRKARGGFSPHTHTHIHTLTLQITYCLVKQKFFITFHKLRLFIRDHNFVLCIFFIPNIFRTAPRSFHHPFVPVLFSFLFFFSSPRHTLSLSLSFSATACRFICWRGN